MNVVPGSSRIEDYLAEDDVIDYSAACIRALSDTLSDKSEDITGYIKQAYEYVRDHIPHSADIGEDTLPCSASEVLQAGHGICFAKSHLLAALLRVKSVPAGFCYQKLILDDDTAPVLVYHGLCGVYLAEYKKWIRLDARGNKEGVNARFSVDEEHLAFPIRADKGEEDSGVVYPNPDVKILGALRGCKTRTELWDNLPVKLGYLEKDP